MQWPQKRNFVCGSDSFVVLNLKRYQSFSSDKWEPKLFEKRSRVLSSSSQISVGLRWYKCIELGHCGGMSNRSMKQGHFSLQYFEGIQCHGVNVSFNVMNIWDHLVQLGCVALQRLLLLDDAEEEKEESQHPCLIFFSCFTEDRNATKSLLDSGQWQYEYDKYLCPIWIARHLMLLSSIILAEAQTATSDGSWASRQRNPAWQDFDKVKRCEQTLGTSVKYTNLVLMQDLKVWNTVFSAKQNKKN